MKKRCFRSTLLSVLATILCVYGQLVLAETMDAKQALAERFVEHFNARDHKQLDSLFDTDAFCDRVARRMHSNAPQQALFKMRTCGVYKKRSFSNMLFAQAYATNPVAKYIGQTNLGRPLIRFVIGGGGYEYLELVMTESELADESTLHIQDLIFASKGQPHSKSTAMTMGLFGDVSESTLKRLLGISEIDKNVLEVFTKMAAAASSGDFAKALQLLDTLPKKIKTTKIILLVRAGYAMQVDEMLYGNALSELNQYYGDDPTLSFALLDYHIYQGDYDKAYAGVESMLRRYGADASILSLQANVLSALGRIDEAFVAIDAALEMEPELVELYTTKMYLLTFDERHRDMLSLIELADQRELAGHLATTLSDSVFDGFRASEAYEDWIDGAVYGSQ